MDTNKLISEILQVNESECFAYTAGDILHGSIVATKDHSVCERSKKLQELIKYFVEKEKEINIVKGPEDARDIFRKKLSTSYNPSVENFMIIMLNIKNEVIDTSLISTGSITASVVHPREVFREAIKRNANAIILGHNHPSGHVNPSDEDRCTTKRLDKAGKILGIKVMDHIIITESESKYYSFKENGLI